MLSVKRKISGVKLACFTAGSTTLAVSGFLQAFGHNWWGCAAVFFGNFLLAWNVDFTTRRVILGLETPEDILARQRAFYNIPGVGLSMDEPT